MTVTPESRRHRTWLLATTTLLGCVITGWVAWRAAANWHRAQFLTSLGRDPEPRTIDEHTKKRIAAFCGDCHALPQPQNFPRDQWHHEVRLGYEFYARSGRRDLDPPPMHLTVEYYRSLAPEQLVIPEPAGAKSQLRASFTTNKLDWNGSAYVVPAVSYLRWMPAPWTDHAVLFVCDMRDGSVSTVDLRGRIDQRRVIAKLDYPCHVESCDLDGDGAMDLVVADLGSLYADDHDLGRVVWLRYDKAEDTFSQIVLASGLGRVADVRAGDLDGDGDLDLIVAEFGHSTGKIILLTNVAARGEPPRFDRRVLDVRPGTIHVPLHDFNGDGRPDFAALVSQEYESVDVFVNQGDARFHVHPAWAAPDVTFGSSGIELVDLDQDGDMDILLTNGDVFDNSFANASHGVQWLENLGDLRFQYHRLTDMPGAYRALAGDIDLDGDLDVVAVALLRSKVLPVSLRGPTTASIVCLEQTAPGVFITHVLETGLPYHAALELGDFDNDGDLDLAIGSFAFPGDARAPARLTIWWNQLIAKPP